MSNRKNERGFTLVELSIVLVIIGLIVGGVLAGQSLINSAKLQAEITQFNKIDTAVNAFYLRNGYLPGDTKNIAGFATAGVAAGDQNGLIGTGVAAEETTYKATEEANAVAELEELGLVPGVAVNPSGNGASSFASSGGDLIAAKVGGGITLYGDAATNKNWVRYGILGDNGAAGAAVLGPQYTADQTFQIDTKLDDGVPTTGLVQARDSTAGVALSAAGLIGAAGAGDCVFTGGLKYNQVDTATECGFAIRLSN